LKILLAPLLALSFHSPALFSQEAGETAPASEGGKECEQATTVFQDVSGIGRENGAAKNMMERHDELTKDGWRLFDMEVYTENGDVEGFLLRYTRAVECSSGQ
jgi:hypothetical protein